MKILYHHRTASRDGQSTHITEMIAALRSDGHEVTEVAPSVKPEIAVSGSPGWVGKLKYFLPRSLYELAELGYSCFAYCDIAKAVKREQPDGIYERYNLYLLAGVWAKWRFRLPLLLEVNAPMAMERREYGGLSWPRLANWVELYVWKRADIVLPVTQVLAEYMVAKGVDPSRIAVIPNAINPAHYQNLPTSEEAKASLGLDGRLVIGFTGFVREWDRLDRIVSWISKASATYNAHLLVIGDGPARQEIEACAVKLGVADRLSFTGVVDRQEVPKLSMAFDIALQTALVPYASPLCLFEYLALGKAIVAPDQPNHHEILADGVNSLMYDPVDTAGIESAIEALCRDGTLRARIGKSAQELIVRRGLTWGDHGQRVIELFGQVSVCGDRRSQ